MTKADPSLPAAKGPPLGGGRRRFAVYVLWFVAGAVGGGLLASMWGPPYVRAEVLWTSGIAWGMWLVAVGVIGAARFGRRIGTDTALVRLLWATAAAAGVAIVFSAPEFPSVVLGLAGLVLAIGANLWAATRLRRSEEFRGQTRILSGFAGWNAMLHALLLVSIGIVLVEPYRVPGMRAMDIATFVVFPPMVLLWFVARNASFAVGTLGMSVWLVLDGDGMASIVSVLHLFVTIGATVALVDLPQRLQGPVQAGRVVASSSWCSTAIAILVLALFTWG